jgi:hypothetical protein
VGAKPISCKRIVVGLLIAYVTVAALVRLLI